jgi:hypothetical protein
MNDIENDPEFQAWKRNVQTNLIPKLEGSSSVVSIMPQGEPDVKYAVELGLSIMMDKPIILVVAPGTKVPAKLALVADDIVEADWAGENMEKTRDAIMAAIGRLG